jgi:hypothetical protein
MGEGVVQGRAEHRLVDPLYGPPSYVAVALMGGSTCKIFIEREVVVLGTYSVLR